VKAVLLPVNVKVCVCCRKVYGAIVCAVSGTKVAPLSLDPQSTKLVGSAAGLVAADEVFGFAARTIQEVLSQQGTPDDFVGVSDDHFVVLTHAAETPALVEAVRQNFAEGVKPFYNFQDVERNGLTLTTAQNLPQHVPLMQLQIEA